ncbi:alpha/beta fold hydrolase [Streptomyces resistomycificus]|uniref:Hydrolase n=1 Tax=Streptomyces resistomycificus TaxID=67356 RepID=A0A0L8L3P1_9ACTN|nr:alpha/beta fold hydrolase [Streptomyces resistomycificus]KOG32699.1 hydrolase [Streptomyces resistomycificus]KUO01155.1 hydrolase [Streptomyces resistomycificus]
MADERLHYDVGGDGPVLLVVPGGAGHPMGLDAMTDVLAERFRVVTYDPLGLAHGRLGLPVGDQRVRAWSDGAHRVLEEVLAEGESAYVVGTSSGAVAALDLLARHPRRLRHVVAHEPPCVGVLPDGARQQAMFREVYDTYRAAGLQAAGARLGAGLAGQRAEGPFEGQPLSREEELGLPMAVFLAHVLVPFTSYGPELGALDARLTLAAGSDSRGQLLYRTAQFLAERTGSPLVEFPGGHVGAVEHPAAFAQRLLETLTEGRAATDRPRAS